MRGKIITILVMTLLITTALPAVGIMNGNIPEKTVEVEHSTGLAPRIYDGKPSLSSETTSNNLLPLGEIMHGYNAYCPSINEGPVYFDIGLPASVTLIADTTSSNFIAGGTLGCNDVWYGCEYGSGVLYTINPGSGVMTSIGGGGIGCNALAHDPISHRLFGASENDHLIEYNPNNGVQTDLGALTGPEIIIGMSFDKNGVLYAWDIITDKLWTIDVNSVVANEVGSLGIDLNYAQDGDFLRVEDRLFLTAYTLSPESGGFLYEVDKTTGLVTKIGAFQDNAEISGSCFTTNQCKSLELDRVTMPRDKIVNRPLLNFLENHPNLFPILRLLLQRLGLQ